MFPAMLSEGASAMLSNRPAQGLALLSAMAGAARDQAAERLAGAIRFAGCDEVQLNEGFDRTHVNLESWAVSADQQAVVIVVLATAAGAENGRALAASGRFTFTTLTHKRAQSV